MAEVLQVNSLKRKRATDEDENPYKGIKGFTKDMLNLKHALFTMHIEDNKLIFDIKQQIAEELYEDSIIEDIDIRSISHIDIVLSTCCDNAFQWIQRCAYGFQKSDYAPASVTQEKFLLYYFAFFYFMNQYSDIKTLKDITRPVPLELMINIISKMTGEEIAYDDGNGQKIAGALRRINIQETMFGRHVYIEIDTIVKGMTGYVKGVIGTNKKPQAMVQSSEDIGISMLTHEIKKELIERGKKYIQYTKNPSYCMCRGFAYKPGGMFGDQRTRLSGRVMIDIAAMRLLNPNVNDRWYAGNPFNSSNPQETVDENLLWMCPPFVYGFSFNTKEWVKMNIDDISDIVFDDTAFDDLIIPHRYRRIFMSCLTQDMPSFDMIAGKGEGKIFLLYGPPGVGKTMTAEAIAEHMKLPLYCVSVGELGLSPESLEEQLTKVMDIAASWGAIILLDEIDVFAMTRSTQDLQRNAMTVIFLRLLERYPGIMFLTTNLMDDIDLAFISRATASVPYDDLTSEVRNEIWKGMLKKAQAYGAEIHENLFKPEHLETLAKVRLNGRDIKNTVRLAYSMSKAADNEVITVQHLLDIVDLHPAVTKA